MNTIVRQPGFDEANGIVLNGGFCTAGVGDFAFNNAPGEEHIGPLTATATNRLRTCVKTVCNNHFGQYGVQDLFSVAGDHFFL